MNINWISASFHLPWTMPHLNHKKSRSKERWDFKKDARPTMCRDVSRCVNQICIHIDKVCGYCTTILCSPSRPLLALFSTLSVWCVHLPCPCWLHKRFLTILFSGGNSPSRSDLLSINVNTLYLWAFEQGPVSRFSASGFSIARNRLQHSTKPWELSNGSWTAHNQPSLCKSAEGLLDGYLYL